QVEGHYTAWLRERLNGLSKPSGREHALVDEHGAAPQIWRTAIPEELYPTSYVGEEACRFLAEQDDTPFLLQVSFPDPHHPFTPPGKYFDMYNPANIELPNSFSHPTGARTDLPEFMLQGYQVGDKNPDAYWPFHADEATVRRMIALNYGTITMIDDVIGQILQALITANKADDTVICFMSDHGDYMGDHGTVLKHGVHTRGLIRVPFIWNDPAKKHNEVKADVSEVHGSAIDFAPTLLQRAGLKIPVGMQGRDVVAKDAQDLPVLIEDPGFGVYTDPDADTSVRSLVFENWRISVFEGSDLGELYELQSDPDELDNLWNDSNQQDKKYHLLQLLLQRQIALRDKSVLATNQA
ncbi:MAG: sulfatase-like hydrolase/transferase, partial [Gammaproteobacteria bacterium]|nr:sulfatase-like hydrolase/transferase [Gammaproteobacteria bacterium]